jgi:Tol biopolymer transport system component/predicted Ser/Thr protein kinase
MEQPPEALLAVGAELGPYRIEALLGSGGMGQVFRARDTRLDRKVAVKVSRAPFHARFEREARTIAKLNHQHICTLYDVGSNYLVMELVEGETLAERLKKGPLPLALALKYGTQIAEALAAAHGRGIIHRDLKPQNIMLVKHGVKVLDFGLAKVTDGEPLTETQAVMGTPAYMAPEQHEGKAADGRADIYALGLVLHEMATGRRSPPPDGIQSTPNLPPQLTALIARCLAVDPEDRWQSARDLAAALGLVTLPTEQSTTPGATMRRRRWLVPAGIALIALAGAAGLWLWPAGVERSFAYSILPPEGTTFLTMSVGGAPALSPDGRSVAFVAAGPEGPMLWVRSLDSFNVRPLRGTEGARYPFWSPDGNALGFIAQGALKTISLGGEQPQVLAGGAVPGTPGAWGPDGTILFAPTLKELFTVPATGGGVTPVSELNPSLLEENHVFPTFLPDGRHYLFQLRGGAELGLQVWVGELGSSERRLVLSDSTNAQYAPPRNGHPGYLLFVKSRTLFAQPFDVDSLQPTGDVMAVAERVALSAIGAGGDFSVSPNGVLAYRVEAPVEDEMVWYDRAGKAVGGIGDRPGHARNSLRLSPDGKLVAFTRQGDRNQDIWISDLEGEVASRLTFDGGRSPVWSSDGTQIAFLRGDTILRKPISGAGAEVVLWTGPGLLAINDWSGDDEYVLFTRWVEGAERGLWLLPKPLDASAAHTPMLLEARGLHGQFAPADGPPRWVSYDDQEATTREVFVRTMPGRPLGKWQVSSGGGNGARWRRDGGELYFVGGAGVVAVAVEAGESFTAGRPQLLFSSPRGIQTAVTQYAPGYDVSTDGERFLATNATNETPSPAINVVVNWQAELSR